MMGQDRATAASLTALDERLLADIGVSRAQIWQASRKTTTGVGIRSGFAALVSFLGLATPSLARPVSPPPLLSVRATAAMKRS